MSSSERKRPDEVATSSGQSVLNHNALTHYHTGE